MRGENEKNLVRDITVGVALNREEIDFIDQLSSRFGGVTRSFVVRRMISEYTRDFNDISCLDPKAILQTKEELIEA